MPNFSLQTQADAFLGSLQERVIVIHQELGSEVVEHIKETLSTPFPPASEAGDPPALRSGDLRASVNSTTDGESGGGVVTTVEADAPHATYLEHGTSRMQARPFMAPVLAEVQQNWAPEVALRLGEGV